MPTAVVILPSTTYRATDFIKAAEGLGVDLIVASEQPPPLDMAERYLQIDCSNPVDAAERIVAAGDRSKIDGVVAADDAGVVAAAVASEKLGLRGNSREAAETTRDKSAQRRLLEKAEVPQPRFRIVAPGASPDLAEMGLELPVVVKPIDRSAGQGVLRVDTGAGLQPALDTVREIVGPRASILVEAFIPGEEIALEGILTDEHLTTLAIFDKPEASTGPTFQETILVTPSHLDADVQGEAERVASASLRALGLSSGPVHVEMKVDQGRVSVIEVAARSIGGLCSQSLNFGLLGTSLETLILRNALAMDKPELKREGVASGVLMIPIPRPGIFRGVGNLATVRAIGNVTGIDVVAREGARVDPPPIGDRYLGFVFARAARASDVTDALIQARDLIEVAIEDPAFSPSTIPGSWETETPN